MTLLEQIQTATKELEQIELKTLEQLEQFRLDFLSKKGRINTYVDVFRTVANEEKRFIGQPLNALKQKAEQLYKDYQEHLTRSNLTQHNLDLSRSSNYNAVGTRHPLKQVEQKIIDTFQTIGFIPYDGPEIEDDWHNFSGLNFAEHHPARDMQDTFFVGDGSHLLRTHTTSVQVRALELFKPPMKVLMPGRVYRNEAVSARAHCFFHQIDGFYINKGVSFADLKGTLLYFAKSFF